MATRPKRMSASFVMKQVQQLLDAQRFEQAVSILLRARKRFPRRIDICTALGSANARLGRFPAARQAYTDACELASLQPDVQQLAGKALQEMGYYQHAEQCFQQAAELDPQSASVHTHLAQILERRHCLDEARRAIGTAMRLAPSLPEANLSAAIIDRRAGDFVAAEERLVRLLSANPPQDIAWKVCYELANVQNNQGRYGDAMDALLEAKKLQAKTHHAPRYVQRAWQHRTRMQESLDELSTDRIRSWRGASKSDNTQAPAVLIGHPRSGTTMCLQMLGAHPDVVGLDEKHVMGTVVHNGAVKSLLENESIVDCLDRLQDREIRKLQTEYWKEVDRVLDEPLGARQLVDKHPQYVAYLPSLFRVFGGAKIVCVVRDPRDVCLSSFMQAFPLNATSISFLSLERTVDHYVRFMACWRRLKEVLPSAWIEVKYEDLVSDLLSHARRVTDFLGIPWNDCVENFQESAFHQPTTTPSYEAVTQPVNTGAIGRWKHYAEYFKPHMEKLRPIVEEYGYAP